jgi:hypothetical protein
MNMTTEHPVTFKRLQREESASFDRSTMDYIHRASNTGLYEIRGLGAKRKLPHFDDLVFLGASLSRYPLEGYREKCSTRRCWARASPRSLWCWTRPSPWPA